MQHVICPNCGGTNFHRSGDITCFVGYQGLDSDGIPVADVHRLRCMACLQEVTGKDAKRKALLCASTRPDERLDTATLDIVTLFIRQVQRMVTDMSYINDFHELADMFGRERLNMAIAVMAEVANFEVGYPLTDEMKNLVEKAKNGHPADGPLYRLLYQALDHVTDKRCMNYAYLVSLYIKEKWHTRAVRK